MKTINLIVLTFVLLGGCSQGLPLNFDTPAFTSMPGLSTLSSTPKSAGSTPSPTLTPTFFSPSTATPHIPIIATVWTKDPLVPILIYHQFTEDSAPASTSYKVRLMDFSQELEDLYQSGFSLVSFENWTGGELKSPPGRYPLILTMDDLFFNNQIWLQDDGTPSPSSGIGILWQFSQEHPDFGFHVALFADLGDKLYGNPDDPEWQDQLARVIVWCIENDAIIYNHTFWHDRLDKLSSLEINNTLSNNDTYLRELLAKVGRTDLIPQLGNYLALPYGMWPANPPGIDALLEYRNPEGNPIEGVFEADVYDSVFLKPPYSTDFDRWHIPRFTATINSIQLLVNDKDMMATSSTCPLDNSGNEPSLLANQIQLVIAESRCPKGIYVTESYIFDALNPGLVNLIFTRGYQ
jgi:hypothetical protein